MQPKYNINVFMPFMNDIQNPEVFRKLMGDTTASARKLGVEFTDEETDKFILDFLFEFCLMKSEGDTEESIS